jgi:hypothetical protein
MSVRVESRVDNSAEFLNQGLGLGREIFNSPLAETEDGAVLLDLEGDRLFKLNPTAVQFWNALRTFKKEDEIVQEIAREHGVHPQQVRRDLRTFLAQVSQLSLRALPNTGAGHAAKTLSATQTPNFPWYANDQRKQTSQNQPLSTACAFVGLFVFDCVLSLFSLKSLSAMVHKWPIRHTRGKDEVPLVERVCRAAERACVWYPKKALCLQRSAVTTCMLRLMGLPAELVIGAQPMPFQAHAWVELRGSVVNDHHGIKRVYRVLARY